MFWKRLFSLSGLALFGCLCIFPFSAALAQSSVKPTATEIKLAGYFSDTQDIFTREADHNSHIAAGAHPVFVVGKKVYNLKGSPQYKDYLGKMVNVSGVVEGETLSISKIVVAEKGGGHGGHVGQSQ